MAFSIWRSKEDVQGANSKECVMQEDLKGLKKPLASYPFLIKYY